MNAGLRDVTAVIPVYNMATFIERTLRSAINQTYPHLSILVVNDGSTDETAGIVSRIAAETPNVLVVTTPNLGVAEARNLGTSLAQTEYVAYLDGDDLWHPTKIERQLAALAAHGHSKDWGACYTFSRVIDEDDRLLGDSMARALRGDFFAEHLLTNPIGNGSNLLVRRDLALAVGGFDPSLAARGVGGCEDLDFQLKLLLRSKIECVPEFLLGYRIHSKQMSSDVSRLRASEISVLESMASAEGVDPTTRTRGLVNALLIASKAQLKLKDYNGFFSLLRRSMQLSFPKTLRRIARMSAEEWRYWWQKLQVSLSGTPARPYFGKTFENVGPSEGVGEKWAAAAQYRWTLLAGTRGITKPQAISDKAEDR